MKTKKLDGWLKVRENHRTQLKDFTTKRSICMEKKCKFYGELSEQGVCHTVIPDEQQAYFKKLFKSAESILAFNRKHNYKKLSRDQIMKRLESEVVVGYINYSSILDELIWLRGENAKLRGKLKV